VVSVTAVALTLKSIAAALGLAMLLRAIARRLRRGGNPRARDRAVTRGLWLPAAAAGVFVAGMALVYFGLLYRWPGWVRTLGFRAVAGAMIVTVPLVLWLGWRTADEEFREATGRGPRGRPSDPRVP
jgi:hypothetical protein